MKIYLAGSIPKGDAERYEQEDWRRTYQEKILQQISNASFLNPDLIRDTVGPELVVGNDLWMIKAADIVLVNIPDKVGAGTSQEMVIAKYWQKPIVTILPKDTHHRRSNILFDGEVITDWIHPFLYTSSDYIAETLDEALAWLGDYATNPSAYTIKDMKQYDVLVEKFETDLPNIYQDYKNQGW